MKEHDIDDITELFTTENENHGIWKQPVIFGKKYKFEVLIFGNDSDSVQELSRKKLKEMRKHIQISSQGNIEEDDEADAIFDDDGTDDVMARFGGIRKLDGSCLKMGEFEIPTENNDESAKYYRAILKGMPELKDFIKKESNQRANFLSKGKKN